MTHLLSNPDHSRVAQMNNAMFGEDKSSHTIESRDNGLSDNPGRWPDASI